MPLLIVLLLVCLGAACGDDANSCQRTLDICLRQSPPGASTSDCYAQYDACLRQAQRPAR